MESGENPMTVSDWWYTGANNAADKRGYLPPHGVGPLRKVAYAVGWVAGYFNIVAY